MGLDARLPRLLGLNKITGFPGMYSKLIHCTLIVSILSTQTYGSSLPCWEYYRQLRLEV